MTKFPALGFTNSKKSIHKIFTKKKLQQKFLIIRHKKRIDSAKYSIFVIPEFGGTNDEFCYISPPPPLKYRYFYKSNFSLLFASFILFLYSCDPPAEKAQAPTYTTIVSGKIITPGCAADPKKGSIIAAATVWADPAKKVVARADGGYRLKVTHPGSFTLNADYTRTDGNYKASAPKTFHTTAAEKIENITLNYGYTTTLSGETFVRDPDPPFRYMPTDGVTVTIEVEGCVVASATSSGGGRYNITTFAHPGTYKGIARFTGMKDKDHHPARTTNKIASVDFALEP